MPNLTTPEGVKQYMSGSVSESDWNKRCDDVKRANGGYPAFWFSTIIMSGFAARTQASWK